MTRCLSLASLTGLKQDEIVLDKEIPEIQIQLDPCEAHSLTVEYTFVVSVKRLRKQIDIHEDGFYCKQQKKKEREMRAEKEKMEKEKLENKRIEEERIEKERIEQETQTTKTIKPTTTPTETTKPTLTLTPYFVEEEEQNDKVPAIEEPKSNNEKGEVGMIAGVAAFVVLSITVAIVSFICWQKHEKKSNGEVALNEENEIYGSYARDVNGEGEYGDGDKVYVTDKNPYYAS